MACAKVDSRLHSHPKAEKAGVAAMGLWTMALSYAADHASDGYISRERVTKICGGPREGLRLAARLVDAGLWHEAGAVCVEEGCNQLARAGEGYRFHKWARYQLTKAEALAERARLVEMGRRGGKSKAAARVAPPAPPVERLVLDEPAAPPSIPPPPPSAARPVAQGMLVDVGAQVPKKKTTRARQPSKAGIERAAFDTIWAAFLAGWLEHMGDEPAPIETPSRRTMIQNRIKEGRTVEELASVAIYALGEPWRHAANFRRTCLTFEHVFRDGAKVERVLRDLRDQGSAEPVCQRVFVPGAALPAPAPAVVPMASAVYLNERDRIRAEAIKRGRAARNPSSAPMNEAS